MKVVTKKCNFHIFIVSYLLILCQMVKIIQLRSFIFKELLNQICAYILTIAQVKDVRIKEVNFLSNSSYFCNNLRNIFPINVALIFFVDLVMIRLSSTLLQRSTSLLFSKFFWIYHISNTYQYKHSDL